MVMNSGKGLKLFFCIFIILLALIPANFGLCKTRSKPVVIIPVEGKVGPAMASFLKRAVAEAKSQHPEFIIFEINTFGGRVDSALDIVDTLLSIDKIRSISYVKTKAISAGALIALSSGRLYMKKGTTIGDCAPIAYSKEGVKEMGEKFQSPLRAQFRALAKRNGFSERLAESMVSKDKEIIQTIKHKVHYYFGKHEFNELPEKTRAEYKFVKTIVKKGELLTMDDVEAKALLFSRSSVNDLDELFDLLKINKNDVEKIRQTWSETMTGYLIVISPILMMIGLAGIYLELKSPGFGIPGAVGVTCLVLALASQHLTGLANYTELLIILAGFVFLGVEIFVLPGFGIAGVLGILLVFSGMVLALQGFTLPSPEFPWQMDIFIHNIIIVLGICIFSLFLSMAVFRYILPRMSLSGKGPFLDATLEKSHADSFESLKLNLGDKGIAISFLRPSGKADFNGNRVDVISQSEFINKGEIIKVIELTKNKIIVEKQEVYDV